MKKNLLFSLFICLAAGCSKDRSVPGRSGIPHPPEYRFIPNWSADTLYALTGIDSSSFRNHLRDTLYSFSISDTSFITYKGITYYLWTRSGAGQAAGAHWFNENDALYTNCFIGTEPFKEDNPLPENTFISVTPRKYYDSVYIQWRTQHQSFIIPPRVPPFRDYEFEGYGGLYSTANKDQ